MCKKSWLVRKFHKTKDRYERGKHKKKLEKLEQYLKCSIVCYARKAYENAYEYDLKVLDVLKEMTYRDIKHNDQILKKVTAYLNSLKVFLMFQKDEGIDNRTVLAFNEALLKEEINTKIFSRAAIANLITIMLVANLKMYRLTTYHNLYAQYKSYFSDYKKSAFFIEVLGCSSGQLSLAEEIMPLFGNFRKTISDMNTSRLTNNEKVVSQQELRKIHVKWNYIKNIFELSCQLRIQVDGLSEIVIEEIGKNIGVTDKTFLQMLIPISYYGEYTEIIHQWLTKIEKQALQPQEQRVVNVIEKNLTELSSGIRQASEPEILPDDKDKEVQRRLLKMLKSKNVTREETYEMAKKSITYYEQRIQEERDLTKALTCLRLLFLSIREERYLKYWKSLNQMLKKQPTCEDADTVYFLVNDFSVICGVMALPLLLEAKRQGCICVGTSPRVLDVEEYQDGSLKDLVGNLNGSLDIRYNVGRNTPWKYNWEIDIQNKKIEAKGMNIYQPIYEIVSRYQFTYFFNYEDDAWARSKTHEYIGIMERIFQYCEEIDTWAQKTGKRVRFISHAPHFPKAAAYRIYCEERGYKNDLNFIVASFGYDNYFKSKNDAKSETLSALNLTKHPYSRHAFLGTKEGFEAYYEQNRVKLDLFQKRVTAYLTYQRSSGEKTQLLLEEKERILNIIKDYKSAGKKVYLFNGKVVFDLGVKFTKGCVHRDMSECITHTVDVVKKNPDALLLIKPHPHESNIDLTMTAEPISTFKDLIKTPLGENTIYLNRDLFSQNELLPWIDLGIVWNGTSALEFAAYGINTLVMDIWGHYDYPIGFFKVKSMGEYEDILKSPENYPMPSQLQERAIIFLNYMGSDSVRIINPYTKTTSLNFHQFESRINEAAIAEYIEKGDKNLEILFNAITN